MGAPERFSESLALHVIKSSEFTAFFCFKATDCLGKETSMDFNGILPDTPIIMVQWTNHPKFPK